MSARLPAWARVVYASGSLSGNIISRSRDLWLLFFYLGDGDAARRGSAIAVGAVLVLVRLLEAFNDPLIGHLSDCTRTRLGRRLPYVLAATPFMAVTFIFLWTPPDPGESMRNVVFLFFALSLFHLFSTLSGGPFEALLPEIARAPEDRFSIALWQMVFGIAGTVGALMLSGPIIDRFGFTAMAILVASVALVSRLVALGGAWTRSVEVARISVAEAPRPRLMESIAGCMRNRQFIAFLPSQVLYSVGIQMVTGVLPFFVTGVLGYGRPGTMVSVISGAALLTLALALPAIIGQARRRSKRAVYSAGMLFAALYLPLLYFVGFIPVIPPTVQIIAFAALLGLPMVPVQTFPNALIADICDYDEVLTGIKREATFYAVQATIEKTAGALAPVLLTLLLSLGSTPDDPFGIRLVGPVAGLLTLIGYLYFRRYWLPDHVTHETVHAVEPSRIASPVPAPLA